MKRFALAAAVTIVLVAALTTAPGASATRAARAAGRHTHRVCATAPVGRAACAAQVVVDSSGKPAVTPAPSGYGPADIRSAYALPASAGGGTTVAVVDAYNDPTAASDLAVYRSRFGLPACTTASGCLRIVNQRGRSRLPATDVGWATEISLDVDMVSAACPACKILLVEADSATFANLGAAVNYAARKGVAAISNSYSGGDTGPVSDYDHPGIAITASTGDGAYGLGFPASFDTVIAVGGTSLMRAANVRGWAETAWSGAGSGCSTLNAKPSWQTSVTQCAGKAAADVSAIADPLAGVAVYDTTVSQGASGWQVFGGTSVSSPIIASVYAMSRNTGGYPASYTWAHAARLFDVTSGSNGTCPTPVWCLASVGWDGPTGLGTPNGTSGF